VDKTAIEVEIEYIKQALDEVKDKLSKIDTALGTVERRKHECNFTAEEVIALKAMVTAKNRGIYVFWAVMIIVLGKMFVDVYAWFVEHFK